MHTLPVSNRARGVTRPLACVATAALAAAAIVAIPTSAFAEETGAAPVLNVASFTPVASTLNYNGVANNTSYVKSTSNGLGGWFTSGPITLQLSATDDTDVAKFTVKVGTAAAVDVPAIADGTSGTATFEFASDISAAVVYSAVDSAGNASATRSINARLDSVAPVVAWPTITPTGKVSRTALPGSINPTKSDAAPSSGGAVFRDFWIDGKRTYPMPVNPATLAVGEHTWAIDTADTAGNAAKYTLTFEVTTSFADVATMLDRHIAAGTVSAANGAHLLGLLEIAQTLSGSGSTAASVATLETFAADVKRFVPKGAARTILVGDAAWLITDVSGGEHPAVSTGVVVSAGVGPARYVFDGPSGPVVNADPDFKVLMFANRVGGFRHEHIPVTEAMIQQLGRDHNFDVDLYDYLSPAESLPVNPFESIELLEKYDAIIGVSSVGNAQFVTNRPTTADPAVLVDEQAVLKQYVAEGGGFVAIHGATDAVHNWPWYQDLTGGEFDNHGSNGNGIQNTCSGCLWAELFTEDGSNAATDQFPTRYRVLDELYNWKTSLPREKVHVLQTLTESTYVGGVGSSAGTAEGADHPISWCQNFEGSRSFTQALLHNWENSYDPMFKDNILEGIKWTAGQTEENCVSHNEVKKIVQSDVTAGELSTTAATKFTARLDASYSAYAAKNYPVALDEAKRTLQLAETSSNGSAAALAVLETKANELIEWMSLLADSSTELRFVTQPESAAAAVGDLVALSVEAKGTDITYQWQKKVAGGAWNDIEGANTFALGVVAESINDNGIQYRVRIGDENNDLNSAPATISISRGESVVEVTSPVTKAYGSEDELVVAVGGNNGVVANGSVVLKEGAVTIGSATIENGSASIALPATLSVGVHSLTAEYAGDANLFGGSSAVSVTVSKAATVSTLVSSSSSVKKSKVRIVTVRVAADGFSPAGTVVFYDGSKKLGSKTLTAGKASWSFKSSKTGTHKLSVEYRGSSTAKPSTSPILNIKVIK